VLVIVDVDAAEALDDVEDGFADAAELADEGAAAAAADAGFAGRGDRSAGG
jgi:hypothetical protein